MMPLVPILVTAFQKVLAHWKVDVLVVSIFAGIGLLASPFTSPKVLAVMVFLSDWNMLWTWEWWFRMIFGLGFAVALWWIERIRHGKQLLAQATAQEAEWKHRTKELREDLKHVQSLLSARDLELAVLRKAR